MTPTPEQLKVWREDAGLAFPKLLKKHYPHLNTAQQTKGKTFKYIDMATEGVWGSFEIGYLRARAEQAAEIAELKAQRDLALSMLASWCVAVSENGASWDEWDEYYKDAMYRPSPIREILDIHIANERKLLKDKHAKHIKRTD